VKDLEMFEYPISMFNAAVASAEDFKDITLVFSDGKFDTNAIMLAGLSSFIRSICEDLLVHEESICIIILDTSVKIGEMLFEMLKCGSFQFSSHEQFAEVLDLAGQLKLQVVLENLFVLGAALGNKEMKACEVMKDFATEKLNKNKNFSCDICKAKFIEEKSLKYHVKFFHLDKKDVQTNIVTFHESSIRKSVTSANVTKKRSPRIISNHKLYDNLVDYSADKARFREIMAIKEKEKLVKHIEPVQTKAKNESEQNGTEFVSTSLLNKSSFRDELVSVPEDVTAVRNAVSGETTYYYHAADSDSNGGNLNKMNMEELVFEIDVCEGDSKSEVDTVNLVVSEDDIPSPDIEKEKHNIENISLYSNIKQQGKSDVSQFHFDDFVVSSVAEVIVSNEIEDFLDDSVFIQANETLDDTLCSMISQKDSGLLIQEDGQYEVQLQKIQQKTVILPQNDRNWDDNLRNSGSVYKHCYICEESVIGHAWFIKHLKLHSESEGPFNCPLCEKTRTSTVLLHLHVLLHLTGCIAQNGELQCPHCKIKFKAVSSLKAHMSTVHPKLQNNKCLESGCGLEFSNYSLFKNHMLDQHKKNPLECEECGVTYKDRNNLKEHIITCHGDKEPQFSCDVCLKKFRKETAMKNHRRTQHEIPASERKVKCGLCKHIATCKGTLNTHVKLVHQQTQNYPCTFCHKLFKQKCNLDNHIRTHTRETPWKCDICHASFKRVHHYQTHLKSSSHLNKEELSRLVAEADEESLPKRRRKF